uniref:Double-strand break repair protein MRE11 n=1 Tax=Arundo donax TaxID=35708 RepID=A0A0A8YRN0_ARUDO
MDREHRQANVEVWVFIIYLAKSVWEVNCLITDNLELHWLVI